MRAVQVLGIAHGGTTIMDRILSSYPGVIGLGEIQQILRKIQRNTLRDFHPCPCGESHLTCPFWGRIIGRNYADSSEFFRAIVETARDLGNAMMVDTSKALLSSNAYSGLQAEGLVSEVIQLRLIRDPRGWVQSMIRRYEVAAGDVNAIRALFYRWLFTHVKLDRKVLQKDTTRVYVWYDKLVIEEAHNRLAALLDLEVPADGQPADLKQANQHAVIGNNFIKSSGRERLRYDGSWMANKLVEDLYAELQPVRDYYHLVQGLHLIRNARMVHLKDIGVEVPVIEQAGESGDFAMIEEQARKLVSTPKLAETMDAAAA